MPSNQVTITDFVFDPQTITVNVGTTLTWINQNSVDHTIVSNDNKFSSNNLAKNNKFSFTFDEAGTFSYHCSIHPNMTGKVIVQ